MAFFPSREPLNGFLALVTTPLSFMPLVEGGRFRDGPIGPVLACLGPGDEDDVDDGGRGRLSLNARRCRLREDLDAWRSAALLSRF